MRYPQSFPVTQAIHSGIFWYSFLFSFLATHSQSFPNLRSLLLWPLTRVPTSSVSPLSDHARWSTTYILSHSRCSGIASIPNCPLTWYSGLCLTIPSYFLPRVLQHRSLHQPVTLSPLSSWHSFPPLHTCSCYTFQQNIFSACFPIKTDLFLTLS